MKTFILTLFIAVLTSCGITGTANKFNFPKLKNIPQYISGVHTINIHTNSNTVDNESYSAYNWGSFDESDKKLIHESILNTLNKNIVTTQRNANIHIQIHRYAQVITNASYASFVIVDWCVELNGKIIVDEVFYAGHSDELNIFTGKTLGWAKGETHKALVSRIINKTIEALSLPSHKNSYPELNIYLSPDEAVKKLPEQLTSVGNSIYSGGAYYYISPQTGRTDFDKKTIYQKVDWKSQIK